MMIKKALICAKDQKTDDELKAIMTAHPWAPSMIHGFYKTSSETWKQRAIYDHVIYDAIWIDVGIAAFASDKWIAESFNVPEPCLRPLPGDPINDAHWERQYLLRKAWWKATSELILSHLPDDYRVHVVYYGEIEDDFDADGTQGGDAAVAERSWRDGLLAHFDYSPKVEAALGTVTTSG